MEQATCWDGRETSRSFFFRQRHIKSPGREERDRKLVINVLQIADCSWWRRRPYMLAGETGNRPG